MQLACAQLQKCSWLFPAKMLEIYDGCSFLSVLHPLNSFLRWLQKCSLRISRGFWHFWPPKMPKHSRYTLAAFLHLSLSYLSWSHFASLSFPFPCDKIFNSRCFFPHYLIIWFNFYFLSKVLWHNFWNIKRLCLSKSTESLRRFALFFRF